MYAQDVIGLSEMQCTVCGNEYGEDDGSQLSLIRKGSVCFGQKRYAAAIAFYEKALQEPGQLDLEILLYLSEAYSAKHDFWQADVTINKVCT